MMKNKVLIAFCLVVLLSAVRAKPATYPLANGMKTVDFSSTFPIIPSVLVHVIGFIVVRSRTGSRIKLRKKN